jgi:hypothetical protein
MPAANQVTSFGPGEYPIGLDWKTGLSLQSAWPGAGSTLGVVVAVLWLAVLSLGIVTLARYRTHLIALPILAFLILQLCLHVLYGVETILYSLNWMPILIIVAMYGFQRLGRGRWLAITVFTLLLAWNNFAQFGRVVRLVQSYQQAVPLSPPENPEQMLSPRVDCAGLLNIPDTPFSGSQYGMLNPVPTTRFALRSIGTSTNGGFEHPLLQW